MLFYWRRYSFVVQPLDIFAVQKVFKANELISLCSITKNQSRIQML